MNGTTGCCSERIVNGTVMIDFFLTHLKILPYAYHFLSNQLRYSTGI